MKTKLSIIFAILLSFTSSSFTSAQSTLPLCTPQQAEIVRVTMTNSTFVGGYGDAARLIGDESPTANTYREAVLAFDALQREWWEKVFPAFPNCDQAQRLGVLGGRVLDEMLIYLSTTYWGDTTKNADILESATFHNQKLLAIQSEFVALAEEVGALARSEATGDSEDTIMASANAGDSRTNPVPFGQRQHVEIARDSFVGSIQLIEYIDDAEAYVLSADSSNEPAPEGTHYIVFRMSYACEKAPGELCEFSSVYFETAGDKGIVYDFTSGREHGVSIYGIGDGQDIFGGTEIEVAVVFLVDVDETNFVLFTAKSSKPRVFFAAQ